MKKRIVSVLLVMAMCVSMSACGSKGAEKKSDGSASGQKKVAVVYAGNLGDKSYNDSCNEGALPVKSDNVPSFVRRYVFVGKEVRL